MQIISHDVTIFLIEPEATTQATGQDMDAWLQAKRKLKYVRIKPASTVNHSTMYNQVIRDHCQNTTYIHLLHTAVVLNSPDAISVMAAELEYSKDVSVVGLRLMYPDESKVHHGGIGLTQNSVRMFQPRNLNGHREFCDDEHIVFAVTFDCAMIRKADFDSIHGFEAEFFANGLSDIDFCCRILNSGKHIFYIGTLTGIIDRSESVLSNVTELEILRLNERYSDLLNKYYVGQYGYNLIAPGGDESWFTVLHPLRYRLADQINDRAKKIAGPIHSLLKKISGR